MLSNYSFIAVVALTWRTITLQLTLPLFFQLWWILDPSCWKCNIWHDGASHGCWASTFSIQLPVILGAKVRRACKDIRCPASGFADKVFVPTSWVPLSPPDACWGTSQMCSDDMSEFVFSCPLVLPFHSLSLFAIPFLLTVVVMHKKTGPESHSVSLQWLLLQRAITLSWQYQREQQSRLARSPSPCTTCRKLPHTSAGRRWSGSDTHARVTFLGGSGLWCRAEMLPGEQRRRGAQRGPRSGSSTATKAEPWRGSGWRPWGYAHGIIKY